MENPKQIRPEWVPEAYREVVGLPYIGNEGLLLGDLPLTGNEQTKKEKIEKQD